MTNNKHKGSDFDSYLIESLGQSDELVFLHIKDALEEPDAGELNDYQYLIKAIADVAEARGKSKFIAETGITRQGLHKILSGKSIPSPMGTRLFEKLKKFNITDFYCHMILGQRGK
jgi:DNA-binding phage protein